MLPVALPLRLPSVAPWGAAAPARTPRSGHVLAATYAAPPAKTAQAPLPRVPIVPVPVPPSSPAPRRGRVWSLRVLQEHAFGVLDDLHARAIDRPDREPPLETYFFAQKRVQVQRVRALLQAAFDYADKHAEHPGLHAALTSDDLATWLVPEPTLEQAMALAAPPPASVVLGALHRLRNAMAQLQLLRQNWPAQPA